MGAIFDKPDLSKTKSLHLLLLIVIITMASLSIIGCEDQGTDPVSPTEENNSGIQLSSQSHNFGSIITGESSLFTLLVTNNGDNEYNIINIDDDFDEALSFTTDFNNQTGVILTPDSTISVEISFNPLAAQEYQANLIISTDDSTIGNVSMSLTGEGIAALTLTWSDVSPIFQTSCTACHGFNGDFSLESYAQAMIGDRITPGDPNNSLLVQRIEGTTEPSMPLGLDPLIETEISTIRNWITQGAPNN